MITAVADPSQVAEARRLVAGFARRHGMPDQSVAQLSLAVTELATNLLKHGSGGHILAGMFFDQDGSGIEVLALDRGPGMADVERCIADGYSTAGSPGNGLGAIIRQSDHVRIYSRPGLGTAITVRFVMETTKSPPPMRIGAAIAPYPGELVCGDNWAVGEAHDGRTVLSVDGSGHGVEAERAADIAVRIFHDHVNDPCERLAERVHRALIPTRGAAIAIARVDAAARLVRYVGIGNITGVLVVNGTARHMISYNGTAGHIAPRIREMTYPFSAAPTVILHSDGLTPRWDLAAYPGLAAQHPSLIAGVLLRDFRRGRDDASVVAMHVLL
ncbi:MAG TPA: ATP-binding SpoIIE family protein phosphatase [Acetobacteraceae bacterium]|jgi:anti-sigma regulatory factor (Ser/Thr protein kinase)|nr:ATP-binding SpoIIE family protein phosphatase [Acetobacteraceae bacterium]